MCLYLFFASSCSQDNIHPPMHPATHPATLPTHTHIKHHKAAPTHTLTLTPPARLPARPTGCPAARPPARPPALTLQHMDRSRSESAFFFLPRPCFYKIDCKQRTCNSFAESKYISHFELEWFGNMASHQQFLFEPARLSFAKCKASNKRRHYIRVEYIYI